ncbi:sugar MFS transporter [Paraferrimonas sedimenticola]|uniref:Glucose/galactose MFS transporter n=1 Tax=Paraferrimonas sedimenticola TaxID=375674 RepID=A0AA37RWA8_9GAMM|nr:sugar MFS transporter [Paraferrimonas sedimenticola]GLP95932.1 glucose/galactose MFS transporter [Paraferrimonas sedimenticola]
MDAAIDKTPTQPQWVPMAIIGTLFFIFGFVTWLNGSLIPFLEIVCELNQMEAYLVATAFYIAYTVMALPMSMILQRTGYRKGMMLGLLIIALGALVFIPAALSREYSVFLLAMFVMGSGLTILQTASNPYIVHIGPKESAAVRISIMGLLNKGAGIVAPVMFTALMLSGMDQFSEEKLALMDAVARSQALTELSHRLVEPYVWMAGVLVLLAFAIKFSPLPELDLGDDGKDKAPVKEVFQYPHLVLGAVALFLYVGVEVIAGDTIGMYGRQLGVENFGMLTSYTMAFMVAGYVIGMALIPRFISQEKALQASALFGILFSLGIMFSSAGSTSIADATIALFGVPTVPNSLFFLALLGLANALVWPAVWPLALDGLGKHTSTGAALLIMGISGGAIMPLLYGAVAESSGDSQWAYWVLLPGYVYLAFYAFKGHQLRRWK